MDNTDANSLLHGDMLIAREKAAFLLLLFSGTLQGVLVLMVDKWAFHQQKFKVVLLCCCSVQEMQVAIMYCLEITRVKCKL